MSKAISLKPCSHKDYVLFINPKKANELGLNARKRAYVSFGSAKTYVNIEITDDIYADEILLSRLVINDLSLPGYPIFEVGVKDNEVIIGPYIGMLVSEDDENITASKLRGMSAYTQVYEKLHGALVVFALNRVDTSNRLIDGYCYNPHKDRWERGTFPYPSSIYRTIGLSEFWQNHFLSVLGNKFFNTPYFNKLDMYKWFSTDPEIGQYLPHTILYESYRDIQSMLDRYGNIYIKPTSGLKGRGIIKASMEDGATVFRYREDRENHTIVLDTPREVIQFVEDRLRPGRYLIQQAINLLQYNGSVIDFRCAVQKNQSEKWVCNAVIGRCGDKGSVVSNISSGGSTYKGVDLLKKALSLPDTGILSIIKRMETLALKVCNTVDKYGINCGTLGLDVGLDVDGRLWLIEINNRDPSPRYAIDLKDDELYRTMKTSPLFYAKALAGFKDEVL